MLSLHLYLYLHFCENLIILPSLNNDDEICQFMQNVAIRSEMFYFSEAVPGIVLIFKLLCGLDISYMIGCLSCCGS